MRKFIRSDKSRCILFTFGLILFPFFGLKILAALQCYPALDGDSWFFGISAVEYERVGITRQPFVTDWPDADISFFPHGYLYQIALTKLSPISGYQGIYISNLVLFSSYLILFLLLCAGAAVNCIVAVSTLIISISCIGPSTFRPELLAANLILVWILAMKHLEERTNCKLVKALLSACVLILLGITQPTIGVLSAAILCYWMIYEHGGRALLDIAFIAVLTVLGIAAITEFVTGSFSTWMGSVFTIGQTLGPPFSHKIFAYLSFVLVELLWIGIVPVAALLMYVHLNKLARVENVADKVLLSVTGGLFVVVFACFQFIYLPLTISEAFAGPRYFIELFVPISIVLLWRFIKELKSYPPRAAFIVALLLPIAGASVSVTRDALVTAIDLVRTDTVPFTEIRKKISGMIAREPLAVDGLFIPAIEGDAKSLLVGTFKTSRFVEGERSDMWGQERAKSQACVIVIKQSNTGLEAPPNIAGFSMVETTFSSPVRLFGLSFYRTPKGYNYAIYRRLTCR